VHERLPLGVEDDERSTVLHRVERPARLALARRGSGRNRWFERRLELRAMSDVVLVRYGAIPEVGRFSHALPERPVRNLPVVVESHRGLELGTLLEVVQNGSNGSNHDSGSHADGSELAPVVRIATADDRAQHAALRRAAQLEYSAWRDRIHDGNLELELIDLEWTLDRRKLVLYVLGGRGSDTTKLALLAATQGLTAIEVQPVAAEGVVPMPAEGGGCGSGGCGCHV
jgi:cell fate regulator YaaT (PSP1 superfamily)